MYETVEPVSPLYDLEADPLGFRDLVQARMPKGADGQIAANLIERLIDEYGYSGYTVPSRGIMTTYRPTPVRAVEE
jgi:transposase